MEGYLKVTNPRTRRPALYNDRLEPVVCHCLGRTVKTDRGSQEDRGEGKEIRGRLKGGERGGLQEGHLEGFTGGTFRGIYRRWITGKRIYRDGLQGNV